MIGDSQIECPKMKQELMPMRQKLIPMKPPWFKKTSFILMLTLMVGANFISIFTIKLNSTHGEDKEVSGMHAYFVPFYSSFYT